MNNETDIKYMKMAQLQAQLSKAVNKKVGAVLVRDNTVVSTGYNGPPRGIPEKDNWSRFNDSAYTSIVEAAKKKYGPASSPSKSCDEAHPDVYYDPRYLLGYKSGFGMKWMIDAHAEQNTIVNAARIGVSTIGCALFCWCGLPCKECMITIINAGIIRIVCLYEERSRRKTTEGLSIEEVSDYNFYLSRWLCERAGIGLTEILEEEILNYEL